MTKQYQAVTDRIVAMIEAGTRPWAQPWGAPGSGGIRPLRHDGTPYRGANVINLWAAAQVRGFDQPRWMTFNQAKDYGGHVMKGAKAELAFYVGQVKRTEENASGEEVERNVSFLKSYCVFNVAEIAGLPAEFYGFKRGELLDPSARIPAADAFIANTGAAITWGGSRAYYQPATDRIAMPPFEQFSEAAGYYGTALHELAHWTKAPHPLDRDLGRKRFGDAGYAMEELVAELAAAFLCCDLGVTPEPREDHAAYVEGWLSVLKSDNRAIFSAASYAEKAAAYLHECQAAPAAVAA
jgi:antirestriction protein ArdC